jgi:hypothetical protein
LKTDLHADNLVYLKTTMMAIATIQASTANINNVSFTEVKKNSRGGNSVSLKYNDQNFKLKLPCMTFAAGVLSREDEKNGYVKYSLLGSLKGCDPYGAARSDETTEIPNFYNFLLDLKEKLIQVATENSLKWFGKKRGEESIRDSFNDRSIMSISSTKEGDSYVPNGKYPPSFTIKIPVYDGNVAPEIVDAKRKPVYVTVDSLRSVFPKGITVNSVVQPTIYIIGQSFGVTWNLKNAQVIPQVRETGASLFEDVGDDSADETTTTVEVPQIEETPLKEVEESVQEPVQETPAVPARKRRVATPA